MIFLFNYYYSVVESCFYIYKSFFYNAVCGGKNIVFHFHGYQYAKWVSMVYFIVFLHRFQTNIISFGGFMYSKLVTVWNYFRELPH